jgi:hypothetical protein
MHVKSIALSLCISSLRCHRCHITCHSSFNTLNTLNVRVTIRQLGRQLASDFMKVGMNVFFQLQTGGLSEFLFFFEGMLEFRNDFITSDSWSFTCDTELIS